MVERDPGDHGRDDEGRHGVRRDDEVGVRAQVHVASASVCACNICIVRTRRRRIPLRMAARCSVKNSSVKALAITRSGTRIDLSMAEPPMRRIDAGWCKVFHQSTENLMIGRLSAPTSVKTAAAREPRFGSSAVQYSAMTPR